MKSLKFLGVILVGFFAISLNANALTISEDYTLEEDVKETIEIAENAEVTLDLNKKTVEVTGNNDAIIINKGATVTIKGDGKVLSEQAAIFNKGGNVTIENGTYDTSVWYTIKNLGTMTLNGGTFTQAVDNSGNSSLIANGWAGKVDKGISAPASTETVAKAIMIINDGTFIHHTTTSTIKGDDWSKTTINGGNFKSNNGTLLQATAEVIVNGGNYVGYRDIAMFYGTGDVGYEPAILTITGGTFSAKHIIRTITSGTLTISGGTFNDIVAVRNPEKEINEYNENITGGTYAIDVKENVKDGYRSNLLNGKYVVSEIFEVLNHGGDNGKLTFDKDKAIAGEIVTITITPNEGYEISKIKIIDKDNNVIEVKDNKFIMPASDVEVKVEFKPIQKTEAPVVDKDNTIGVSNVEKTEEVLLESLAASDKYKDLSVTVEVLVDDIKVNEEVTKEFTTALENEKVKTGKIVSYFDITVAVKNTITEKIEGTLSELTEKIEFKVALPEIEAVKEGYTRKYYVIKKHDDKVEVINAISSEDGKYITFETSEFSTYALAYEDVVNSGSVAPEAQPEVPQTFDGITTTLIIGSLSLFSVVGIYLYFKRELENK